LALPLHAERAADQGHRYDAEINIMSQPAIEAHFFVAEMAPVGQSAEVNETQLHGLFDFVGEFADEKYDRNVSLPYFD
jgi:hypothetical protein